MREQKHPILTLCLAVMSAFLCGFAYETGRRAGKAVPAASPKEYMSQAGHVPEHVKTLAAALREFAQQRARAQANGGRHIRTAQQ